ncbi:metallopeptidase family protein [Candidatus Kaiserbacteria bacterium]|nr:metallopeptidase family protein [Candidatus Kaiserbacteria bacterium]
MPTDSEFNDLPPGAAMSPGGKSAALGKGMPNKEFDALVAEAFEMIPEKFRDKVKNVGLLVDDEPSDEVRKSENLKPNQTLLGLYHGIPATERGDGYGVGMTLPDTITVYRKPILKAAAAEVGATFDWGPPTERMKHRIRDIIRDTIWHEIAHYFGMDEYEVDAREVEGTNEFKA